jgi:hypothetical protein
LELHVNYECLYQGIKRVEKTNPTEYRHVDEEVEEKIN